MARKIEIVLEERGIRAVAEMLDDEAPKTCRAVWDALPKNDAGKVLKHQIRATLARNG